MAYPPLMHSFRQRLDCTISPSAIGKDYHPITIAYLYEIGAHFSVAQRNVDDRVV